MSPWRTWFEPRRDWAGRRALVPVETCYRILDLCAWAFTAMGAIATSALALMSDGDVARFAVFWIAVAAVAIQLLAAIFRGLPFGVRYGIFAGTMTVFLLCTTMVMGITPNWAVLVILLLATTSMFYGLRPGWLALALLLGMHVVVAWGWSTGRLPLAVGNTSYADFRLPGVWVRVLAISACLVGALQLLMSYVLGDMNRALDGANAALRLLKDEQERRARTERKFATIFNQLPDICTITRVSDSRILDVNRAFEVLTGWSRDEAVGRTGLEIGIWPDASARERVLQLLVTKGELSGHEVSWRNRAGELRVGLLSVRPMEIEGEPVLNVVVRDITDRRRRERALQSFGELTGGVTGRDFFAAAVRYLAEELGVRYVFIVEKTAAPDGAALGSTLGVWADGPADAFTYRLGGSPCELVVAEGVCHFPDRVAELFPADRVLAELGARSYAGVPIRDHTGQTQGLVAVLDGKPMPEAETASVLLVLVATRAAAELQRVRNERDITRLNAELEVRVRDRTAELAARVSQVERLNVELRASQEAADRAAARLQEANSNLLVANQELEAYSYSVSHDLRAPLRNITGFLELLGRRVSGRFDAESTRFIAVVNAEATRMGGLIDDLLTFSRVGRTEMTLQPVDMAQLIDAVREELRSEIGDRTIEWKIGSLPTVSGDRALLHQVVSNLVGNAVKFTRPRAVAVIEIGAHVARAGDGWVTFFVRDNGAGFNPRYLDKLFRVFQRLHHSRDFEGTGIGLANVKRVVNRHGGRVWAEGAVDQGAVFYFTLPQAA